jgi:hypothetical protein
LSTLCRHAFHNRSVGIATVGSVEFFAGVGLITYFKLLDGVDSLQFDKAFHASHDCRTPLGFRAWMDALMLCRAGALNWYATQCSGYVQACRSVHQRSAANDYNGDCSKLFVRDSNHMHDITALLYCFSSVILTEPMLEQPLGSVLPKMDLLSIVLDCTGAVSPPFCQPRFDSSYHGCSILFQP